MAKRLQPDSFAVDQPSIAFFLHDGLKPAALPASGQMQQAGHQNSRRQSNGH